MTSRCNDAVGYINRNEEFHRLALRLSNIVAACRSMALS